MADISINPVTRRTQYTNNTGLGPFAFNFNILQNTDIVVYKNSTLLTLTTDYTVTINANGTGSVTLTGSGNGTALVLADLLTIVGGRELSRTTDFVTAGDLLASSLNEQLDSNVIMVQQLDERFDRAMKLNIADEDGDLTLPLKSSRAGKTLAFDSSGNPVVGEDIGNWRGNWVAGTTYTVRDLVKDGSNNNVYRVNTAHTSSGSTPLSSNANSSYYDLVVDAESATTSATNAANSATAAASSASAASTSASNASTSATNASNSASAASTSASNAATSETNASNSATSAATQASNAATSASNASTSASNASTSETNAAASAVSASNSATSAASSASSAATSATNAGTSAGNASTSETNAANSASAAATSASNASTSETNAAASAASAAASFDAFDDIYLGAKASDPTVDNDGDALTAGDQYFNTTTNVLKVYNGSAWQNTEYSDLSLLDDVNITTPADGSLLFYDTGTSKWIDNVVSGDITIADTGVAAIGSGVIVNDDINASAAISVSKTALVDGTGLTLTGDTLSVDASQTQITSVGTLTGFTSTGIDDNATSTAITIDSSQNVGIGGTPFYSLDVQGSATDYEGLRVLNTNTAASPTTSAILLGVANSVRNVYTKIQTIEGGSDANETRLAFFTNNSSNNLIEALRIDENQNVGIGVSPAFTAGGSRKLLQIANSTNGAQIAMSNSSSESENPRIFSDSINLGFATASTGGGVFQWYTAGSERMRLDSSGNVILYNNQIKFSNTSYENRSLGIDSTGFFIYNDADARYDIQIDSSGNVGINKTPTVKLEILGSASNAAAQIQVGTNGYPAISFLNAAGAQQGYITTNASSVSYTSVSDYRLKENVTYDWDATTRLKQLKPARFNFIADADTTIDGFLAHEVSSIVPEAILGEKDEMQTEEYEVTPAVLDDDGNVVTEAVMGTREVPKYQGIDQSKLVPLLVKTIQELEARITALEGN